MILIQCHTVVALSRSRSHLQADWSTWNKQRSRLTVGQVSVIARSQSLVMQCTMSVTEWHFPHQLMMVPSNHSLPSFQVHRWAIDMFTMHDDSVMMSAISWYWDSTSMFKSSLRCVLSSSTVDFLILFLEAAVHLRMVFLKGTGGSRYAQN